MMTNHEYDPDPDQWLALGEQVRIRLVAEPHRRAHSELPNLKAHAVFHVIVENQIAVNLASALRGIARLRAQGLDRHDVIHAVASVLAEPVNALFNTTADAGSTQVVYDAAVDRLTAKQWRDG